MFRLLNLFSQKRTAWLLLTLSALTLEMVALWLQHVWGIKPCVICVYQRCVLFAIAGAGIIAAIAPRTSLRWVALIIWLYSSWKGITLSWHHTMMLLHPNPFDSCEFAARFPSWLPLDTWLPQIFVAGSDCATQTWTLLRLTLPQWLLGIFNLYFFLAVLILIAQMFRTVSRTNLHAGQQ